MIEKSCVSTNPIVFLDIKIGRENGELNVLPPTKIELQTNLIQKMICGILVGRIVIELRKDICPKTCENFRSLCTGEKGLCYRGSKFHKVIKLCHAQGGDIKNYNGTSGETIYGKYFEDENFTLKHDAGVVSMANFGEPNTNNSQFFITSIECPHFDGTNVVFGKVLKGLPLVSEMENCTNDDGVPQKPILISNCGEFKIEEDWGYLDNDETMDTLPPFPADWERYEDNFSMSEKLEILSIIKESGNYFYRRGDFVKSARKYKKLTRFYNFFKDHTHDDNEKASLDTFQLVNLTNLAATELKLQDFNDVIFSCNAAIKLDPNNSKAFYRRGVANLALNNYEMSLDDLKVAHKLLPGNKAILKEFDRAKKYLLDYRAGRNMPDIGVKNEVRSETSDIEDESHEVLDKINKESESKQELNLNLTEPELDEKSEIISKLQRKLSRSQAEFLTLNRLHQQKSFIMTLLKNELQCRDQKMKSMIEEETLTNAKLAEAKKLIEDTFDVKNSMMKTLSECIEKCEKMQREIEELKIAVVRYEKSNEEREQLDNFADPDINDNEIAIDIKIEALEIVDNQEDNIEQQVKVINVNEDITTM
ncbi:CLUMA_CG012853, isoform A [Clunio marinus]|uniref:peptidylprolyl isomerase n=1 Tax=Clunio marinus TaxID=568069 RepID=A0A1J1IKC8_9DIPT|nr:CLUMA_CG012853, isoform A [Clunio marinus]